MPTVTTRSARKRLLAEMGRLFADDAGLGVLVKYNGRPDLTRQDKEMQRAWSRALVAVHGRDRAAAVYAEYASDRQDAVTEPIGSWNNLVLNTKPLSYWTRDLHGFLCGCCGGPFSSVVIDGIDAVCNKCARENSTVENAQPEWHAYSRGEFIFPGLLPEETPKGEHAITIRYQDGEVRDYTTGEAGLFVENVTSLPGFVRSIGETYGESRDRIHFAVEARTEHRRRSFDIVAIFTYDPNPEGWEKHAYGFRFDSARLTHRRRPLGHYDVADPTITEHTDLYETVNVLLTGLYGTALPES
ncbi:hypothetical protein [Kitasatospora sp. NBC_01300]|uniref:hypothetical protein n=1 Tax=Kitasatospora sp. NBC_01300 TaxID=2903574 RepID=UPI002F915CF0|nr:hypothetical protein OG556_40185 [Kitasatospora sp. NBC_01300]